MRAFVSSVVSFRREKVAFVLFCLGFRGVLYIFPLRMGKELFGVFSTDLLGSANRTDYVSSPCALPEAGWLSSHQLLTVLAGLHLPHGHPCHVGVRGRGCE